MDKLTDAQLTELSTLVDAAEQSPFVDSLVCSKCGKENTSNNAGDIHICKCLSDFIRNRIDLSTNFISYVPALVAEVRELRARVKELELGLRVPYTVKFER